VFYRVYWITKFSRPQKVIEYWIREFYWIEYGPNVGTRCRYWITEVIELDSIVLDKFYCNGQTKSTNKMISSLFIKLVNENCTNWDEHLHTVLYVYCTTFKVTTGHTSFQLVYGLYPLMPIEYLPPTSNSHLDQDFIPIHMVELEHLDETCEEAIDRINTKQWNTTLWAQQNHKIK
jgi:hypothetical protein